MNVKLGDRTLQFCFGNNKAAQFRQLISRSPILIILVPIPEVTSIRTGLYQRGQCILVSVVFTLSPPSHNGSVWLLPCTLSTLN